MRSIAVILALTATASADASHLRDRETSRWLSLGGVIGSVAFAGAGAGILLYRFGGDRGQDPSYRGLQNTGETLIGIGAASTLFTPSLGEWYSGSVLTTGVKLRGAGLGVGLLALAIYYGSGSSESCYQIGDGNYCGGGAPHDVQATALTAAIATGIFFSGIVYDLVDAPTVADHYNERLTVTPTVIRSAGITLSGVAVAGAF
jgi:hypothetical protein